MAKYIDFLVIPQGQEPALNIRVRSWMMKALAIAAIIWVVAMISISIFYGKLSSRAVTAGMLKAENEKLRDYNAKVLEIEKSFRKNLAMVSRIAEMAGVEIENVDGAVKAVYDSLHADSSTRATVAGLAGDPVALSEEELDKLRIPKGRPLYGWVTRGFNPSPSDGKEKHDGIDIAVKDGTPIVATATGIVVFSGWDKIFGNMIIIDHENNYKTEYGHNQKNMVNKGQKVFKGDVIALSGGTGRSSAPHLHYEVVKDGEPVDPLPYLD